MRIVCSQPFASSPIGLAFVNINHELDNNSAKENVQHLKNSYKLTLFLIGRGISSSRLYSKDYKKIISRKGRRKETRVLPYLSSPYLTISDIYFSNEPPQVR
jgi:hypothetical protein